MKIDLEEFRVPDGKTVGLKKWPTALLIFQAMDAAGKEGVIAHVLTGVNPQGCDVYSFKHRSAEELEHDFLWRTTCRLPARGRIGVFNRSYYEEVLIVRVHPGILRSEGIPDRLAGKKTVWEGRYCSIVDLSNTFIATVRGLQTFSFTCRRRSGESAFWTALMSRTRTGNSTRPTSPSGNSGINT